MMLLTGQPLLQNGMPQSMQRALCTLASSSFSAEDELAVVLDALRDGLVVFLDAPEIQEAGDVAHLFVRSFVRAARYFGAAILAACRRCAPWRSRRRLRSRLGLAERRHRLQADLGQRALVLVREHLDELRQRFVPVVEDLARAQAPGPLVVVGDQRLQEPRRPARGARPRARATSPARRPAGRVPSETIEVLQRDANWPSSS